MKIDNTNNNNITQLITKPQKQTDKKAQSMQKVSQNTTLAQTINTDTIKSANANIGKLQTLQEALDSIEQKVRLIQKINDETQLSQKTQELKTQIIDIMANTKFQGQRVFDSATKDSQGHIVLNAIKLDVSLLGEDKRDLDIFNQEIKEIRKDVKNAIKVLAQDAQTNAEKIHTQAKVANDIKDAQQDSITQEKQPGKIASFFKNFGEFLRSSHNQTKLDSGRVSRLLS